jgi:hypothetical protein
MRVDPDGPLVKEIATMRSTWRLRTALTLAAGLALLSLGTAAARADEKDLNINKRGSNEKEEKQFMVTLTKEIIKAAHETSKEPYLEKYEIKKGKEANRASVVLTGGYYGFATSNKYTADIEVKVDTTKPDEWKVLEIEYKDSNTKFKPNKTKIDKLMHKLNGQS